jgi:hypothetical protein
MLLASKSLTESYKLYISYARTSLLEACQFTERGMIQTIVVN